ncbi:MAG: DNA translocase FtsK 4TM domain-containing protein [Desulfobaccales bacterium]
MAKKSPAKQSGSRKAKAATRPAAAAPASRTQSWPRRLGQEMTALLLLGLAGLLMLALVSHSLRDPQGLQAVWNRAAVQNAGGRLGPWPRPTPGGVWAGRPSGFPWRCWAWPGSRTAGAWKIWVGARWAPLWE